MRRVVKNEQKYPSRVPVWLGKAATNHKLTVHDPISISARVCFSLCDNKPTNQPIGNSPRPIEGVEAACCIGCNGVVVPLEANSPTTVASHFSFLFEG